MQSADACECPTFPCHVHAWIRRVPPCWWAILFWALHCPWASLFQSGRRDGRSRCVDALGQALAEMVRLAHLRCCVRFGGGDHRRRMCANPRANDRSFVSQPRHANLSGLAAGVYRCFEGCVGHRRGSRVAETPGWCSQLGGWARVSTGRVAPGGWRRGGSGEVAPGRIARVALGGSHPLGSRPGGSGASCFRHVVPRCAARGLAAGGLRSSVVPQLRALPCCSPR